MKQNDKFGIVMSVAVTAIALAFVGTISPIQDGSISPQGEQIIDRTASELKNTPDDITDITSEAIDTTEAIIESDSVSEALDVASELVDDELPDIPKVVKQDDGKLLELVSIPFGTGVPGCEDTNTCYLPVDSTVSLHGEIIWTNNDDVAHTVTSGNIQNGPNGLFDSGLILPGDTYSVQFDTEFEYDYFCVVHPWMQGTIVVA